MSLPDLFVDVGQVVLAAVHESGLALRCAAPMLQGDRDIVLTAVEENGNALEFAAEELQDDRPLYAC